VGSTAAAVTPGKRNSSLNWPTHSHSLSPWPTFRPALPNGIPSSIACSPRSSETGRASHWTPTRRC
jgi:hypothetical protein